MIPIILVSCDDQLLEFEESLGLMLARVSLFPPYLSQMKMMFIMDFDDIHKAVHCVQC